MDVSDFTLMVAAAGRGERLGLGPKAYLTLGERTLLEWVVALGRPVAGSVCVAVPPGTEERAAQLLSGVPGVRIIDGGATRQETYRRLLAQCATPFVIARDVSRPLASTSLIRQVAIAAHRHGAAGVFVPSHVPLAIARDGCVTASLEAGTVRIPANPQACRVDLLHDALNAGIERQTLWELLVAIGHSLHIVDSDEVNPKITVLQDWVYVRDSVFPHWLNTCSGGECK